jgi:hypothetical protein
MGFDFTQPKYMLALSPELTAGVLAASHHPPRLKIFLKISKIIYSHCLRGSAPSNFMSILLFYTLYGSVVFFPANVD